jgi:ATP-dependent Lon protease
MSADSSEFSLPVLALKDAVVFPQMTLPVVMERPDAIAAIEATLHQAEKNLMVLAQKNPAVAAPQPEDLFGIGTMAVIRLIAHSEKIVQILLQGVARCEVLRFEQTTPFLLARVRLLPYPAEQGDEIEALQMETLELANKYLGLGHPELNISFPELIPAGDDILQLIYPLTQLFIQDYAKAQSILAAPSRKEAMRIIQSILSHEVKVLELRDKIHQQAHQKLSREQQEYVLRAQLQEIREQLGDKNPAETEVQSLRERMGEMNWSGEIQKEVDRELARLERTPANSPDYQIILAHLELIMELPWTTLTADNLDLGNARQVLDEDHYGLKEIKERIIEHLAVMQLNPEAKGPILCFVGPPGVGKTSLGQSIARALGRKFEHFSLGGLHDEAELRGHRRTYIGAMPGRIIQCLRRSGTKNPLLMLDEIDKLGRDFRGDPAAALMEVLDPEQNSAFRDNYLDLPFDLSHVFFITTANTIDTIPKPLLDRMEMIHLSGYYEEEKVEIAHRYLWPRQKSQAGLEREEFAVDDQALAAVIRRYTREAGVRELERMLGRLARKVAVRFAEDHTPPGMIRLDHLAGMLGPERFFVEELRRQLPVGVATGLAWTETGGDVLYVETIILPEKEKFTLTGHLGEVMKESAQAANSYVLSHREELGIERYQAPVHIHVPAGAIPKDGPSAGVTIAAALASLYTNLPVRSDTAMTGEITLSGLVLPVGGIKEKLLAAQRAGIRRVIMPKDNRKDLNDLPEYATREMEFILVETIQEALAAVIPRLAQGVVGAESKSA